MRPIAVDVYALLPEAWGLCAPCGQVLEEAQGGPALRVDSRDDLPAEWQASYEQLAQVIRGLRKCYGERVLFRLVDARSPAGLAGAIRYGIRRYPTFVIAGREKVAGLDRERLEQALVTATAAQEA